MTGNPAFCAGRSYHGDGFPAERAGIMQDVLERRTHRPDLILRKLLGTIRLEPMEAEHGRPYYKAVSSLNVLPLLEKEPGENGSTKGSNTLHWWRRRESNPIEAAINNNISVS